MTSTFLFSQRGSDAGRRTGSNDGVDGGPGTVVTSEGIPRTSGAKPSASRPQRDELGPATGNKGAPDATVGEVLPLEMEARVPLSQDFERDPQLRQVAKGAVEDLPSRFAAWAQSRDLHATVDVNALVQWVLREAYLENTADLRFYAEKVKFYNNLKKSIRAELTAMRAVLSDNAQGTDDSALAGGPIGKKDFLDMPSDDGTVRTVVTERTDFGSGQGVRQVTDAQEVRALGLKPPPPPDHLVFVTQGGYVISMSRDGKDVSFHNPSGTRLSRIWGDPHVDEDGDGQWDWHYGEDSTFVLPDGTKVCMDSEQAGAKEGVFYNRGMTILSGDDRVTADGRTQPPTVTVAQDRVVWDAQHADATGHAHAGVFALGQHGEWAKYDRDTKTWVDVSDQSWADYQNSKAVATGGKVAVVNREEVARATTDGDDLYYDDKAIFTKGQLQLYVDDLEQKLNSVGDDAQLANVDLQNMMQRQQQTLQLMSNTSKMLHDTAMAIIRKIGG